MVDAESAFARPAASLVRLPEHLHEPLGDATLVQFVAPLLVADQLPEQHHVGLLTLEDQVVEVLVAELLPGAALARALAAPLQLRLHVRFQVLLARLAAALPLRSGAASPAAARRAAQAPAGQLCSSLGRESNGLRLWQSRQELKIRQS